MIMSLILFENEFLNIVSISFTFHPLVLSVWFTDPAWTSSGTFTWSSRSSRCFYTPSASLFYPSISVCISLFSPERWPPLNVWPSVDLLFVISAVCLEGGRHHGGQRSPVSILEGRVAYDWVTIHNIISIIEGRH